MSMPTSAIAATGEGFTWSSGMFPAERLRLNVTASFWAGMTLAATCAAGFVALAHRAVIKQIR